MDEKIPKFISDRVDVKTNTVLFFSETLQCIKESDMFNLFSDQIVGFTFGANNSA